MDSYDDFVASRRPALVEGAGGGAAAEVAVARALARCRRRWARLERTTDVDAHVRQLVADEIERPRRRLLTLSALGVLVLLVAAVAAISLVPPAPAVRTEVNPVPVPWFADGELHLADVVVELPGAGTFVSAGDGVVIEDGDGSLLRIDADGQVSDFDAAMPDVARPETAAPYDGGDAYSREIGVTAAPSGEIVHLMEVAASGPEAGVFFRLSETARRLFLVCDAPDCASMERIVVPGNDVRLR